LHNYHDTHQSLPYFGVQASSANPWIGGLVGILPFIEQNALHEQITSTSTFGGVEFPPYAEYPALNGYVPWTVQIPAYQCPSDPRANDKNATYGRNSYCFSV